jgi:membrane associated rhomboid family serine protease
MREAPVGQRCPDCVKEDRRTVRQARTVFGGRPAATPWVTCTIIALNVVIYVLELIHPSLIDRFDDIGTVLIGADGRYYVDDGLPNPGFELVGVLHGEWWRMITSAFLHELPGASGFGLTHILFNMVWVRYTALYLLSALGGSVLVVLLDPAQGAIGASGAGFGLAAAYFVITRKLHSYPLDRNQLIISFLLWMVLAAGFTSWQGHLGGLLTGAVVALGIAYAPRLHQTAMQAAALAAVTVVLIASVVGKALAG